MAKLKKRNLINLLVNAVALVDKGANKKTFYLTKRNTNLMEEDSMSKELAMQILKAKNFSKEEAEAIIKSVAADNQAEVRKAYEDSETNSDVELDEIIEKAGAKFSKETNVKLEALTGTLTKALELLSALSGKVDKLKKEKDAGSGEGKTEEEKEAAARAAGEAEVSDEDINKAFEELDKELNLDGE